AEAREHAGELALNVRYDGMLDHLYGGLDVVRMHKIFVGSDGATVGADRLLGSRFQLHSSTHRVRNDDGFVHGSEQEMSRMRRLVGRIAVDASAGCPRRRKSQLHLRLGAADPKALKVL